MTKIRTNNLIKSMSQVMYRIYFIGAYYPYFSRGGTTVHFNTYDMTAEHNSIGKTEKWCDTIL